MGFKDDKHQLLNDLENANYDHEARSGKTADKNLLAAGLLSVEEAIEIVRSCSGRQHKNKPHHQVGSPPVWEFTPTKDGVDWYIKGYFLGDQTWFISFHPSE